MADVAVTIPVSNIQYITWLRTSYIGRSLISETGVPMIEQMEIGPDQEDALMDFLNEATREVLKVFMTRQGDVTGVPFEYDEVNVTYRFNEATPLLPQASAIKGSLNEDVKNAIYTYTTFLWFQHSDNQKQAEFLINKYNKLTGNIDNHLYKLHD